MGHDVRWLDSKDDLAGIDFSGTFFITEHEAAKDGMPIRSDCFYAVHGANNDAACQEGLQSVKWVGWNVYLDNPPGVNTQENLETWNYQPCSGPRIMLEHEVPFWPEGKRLDFRWATDQLPHEIQALKPQAVLGRGSRVINWVGTVWFVNDKELAAFNKACGENHIQFRPVGAGQRGVVSIEENIRLVRESYMAPAISGSHHNVEGYAPCRIFKNISYGQMGITNNPFVNRLFQNKLIFEPDPYKLFYVAKERLESLDVKEIHDLMDVVAARHTYMNRIVNLLTAAGHLGWDV